MPTTTTTSPLTSPRSSRAAGAPSSGRCWAAISRGLDRSRLPDAISIAPPSSPVLTRIACAVARLPQRVDRRHVHDRLADAGGGQHQHRDERDVREAGHASTDSAAHPQRAATGSTRARAGRSVRRARPSRPARWSQSNSSVSPRGEVCAACPAAPGTISTAAAASSAPNDRDQLGDRARARARDGRATARPHAATQNSAKHSSRSTIARPNAVTRNSGTSAVTSNTERSESFAVAKSRYTGIAIRPSDRRDHERDRQRPAGSPPRRVVTAGRAISSRSTNRPIAAITDTNIAQRVISSCGVVAVAEMFGTRNCGAGPGFGPTA